MKKYFTKIGVIIVILTLVFWTFSSVQAGVLSSMKDTMSRLKASTASNHTISFNLATGNTFATTETIIITFATGFDLIGLANTDPLDYDIKTDTGGTPVDEAIVAAGGCATNDAIEITSIVGQVITFTACDSYTATPAAAGIEIEIGTNATLGGNGNTQITNPTAGTKVISIAAGGDSGSLAVVIVSDEQVSITATVDPSLTFDLDTATTDTESAAPYSVALGTLTTGAVGTSDGSSINSIWVDLATNAVGGAAVTVLDVGSTSVAGLYSTSKTKNIISATTVLTAGTEGYGICVRSVAETGGGPLVAVSPYNTGASCTYTTGHSVGALSLTAASILNTTSAAISGGRAEILVKAAISGITPAATDYADTYTFIATGTF